MDHALFLNHDHRATQVRNHFESYLNRATLARHRTIVFHDGRAPDYLVEGLSLIPWTELELVDVRLVANQSAFLAELARTSEAYLSIHELVLDTFVSPVSGAVGFAKEHPHCDFTSYEFPRFDCTDAQRDVILERHFAGDPLQQRVEADRFYRLLERQVPYRVTIRSGANLEHVLEVSGANPWLELCGPLVAGDIRFTPGCELFYAGDEVNGEIELASGVNIVPLKCERAYSSKELDAYQRLLDLAKCLRTAPATLSIRAGKIETVSSASSALRELLALDEAYGLLNEVGIGLNPAASPLISGWAANTNEAVPGVHLGFGADPGRRARCETAIHFDFVEPNVCIDVNGERLYDRSSAFEGSD